MKRSIIIAGFVALIALIAVSTLPCLAAESAVLRNGFEIRHERRQVIGDVTRLYVNTDGSSFVDVPTLEIDHFEEAASAVASPKFPDPSNNIKQPADLNELVNAASGMYKLDPDLVTSVIRAESGFNVHAVSPKGAQGLMQLMPQTASQLGVQNAFDPQANVEAGSRYLRELLERYDFDLIKALAAYNAGPQRVEQYGGVPPYYETHAYVARIVRDFNRKKLAQKSSPAAAADRASVKKPNAPASTTKPAASNVQIAAKPSSTTASK
ncbi:MAG: lytic transglycosylase domain-containing protein [Candidatus Sulfotelmatobacter sp.]